jgi:hypothetical protein
MLPPRINTVFTVILFGVACLVLGVLSLGLLDVVFHTTKALSFLSDGDLLLFVALFTGSFSLVPLAAARSQRSKLIWFLAAWVAATSLTGLVVSTVTAIIHRQTLSIPEGLIPVGLLIIPVVSGIAIFLVPHILGSKSDMQS